MVDQTVTQTLGNLALESLDFRIDEFDHLAGFHIDQMIVMCFGHGFVARTAVTEIVAVENARFLEQAHGAIDRGDRDLGIDCGSARMEQFHIGVIIAFGQYLGDDPALFGNAQAFFCA